MAEQSRDERSPTEKGVSDSPPRLSEELMEKFHYERPNFLVISSPFRFASRFDPDVIRSLKRAIEDESVATNAAKKDSPQFHAFEPSGIWPAAGDVKEMAESISRMYARIEGLKYGMPMVQNGEDLYPESDPSKIKENGEHKPLLEHLLERGKPVVMAGNEYHIIDIPGKANDDSPWVRFLNEQQDQKLHGNMAMLCTGVSAQNILALVGGSTAMNIPEPVFYAAAAANAVAFVGSFLALLLIKKKPYAAGILEVVGFVSAIVTFLSMMAAFVPWQ